MAIRGRVVNIPKISAEQKKKILNLYYEQGIKQQQIKEKLNLQSVSIVAEILRRDMIQRVEDFKKVSPESAEYPVKVLEIIKFLKVNRKLDYSSIATMLQLPKDFVFKTISDETAGLRNTLTKSERQDRNREMIKLSKSGLSVTEIGKRMNLSKQMVSRIFTDMGYKPIRNSRKVRVTQKELPELMNFMRADVNAKLSELNTELKRVKTDSANMRNYYNKIITELRCSLIQALAEHLTLNNIEEFKKQCKIIRMSYTQLSKGENKPSYFTLVEETVKLIDNATRRKEFKEVSV